jgi:hypothetical protein
VIARGALLLGLTLTLGGCFLLGGRTPGRPDPAALSGPTAYVEQCENCHASARTPYGQSLHAAMGIRCGQCHPAGNHPDFARPVSDATCGGCHQPEFQQTRESLHFAARTESALDTDRAARAALRRNGFTVAVDGRRTFAGDATSHELGGRLCAACHFDEHGLGLRRVRRADFCVGCHTDRETHFPTATAEPTNRCLTCHVRVGDSATGQAITTHRFAR